MLWETLKFYLSSSWAWFSLLAMFCLLSFYQLLSLTSILRKLRKNSSSSERTIRTSDLELSNQSSTSEVSFPAIIAKTSAVMLIMCVAFFAFGAMSLKQKRQCTATGDISYSDGMTVTTDFRGINEGWIINKYGVKQHICITPTTSVDWIPGVYIKRAFYEYRDSCMDFSVKDAWFEADRDKDGNYILAKGDF